jgi:hypothetical protein
VQQPGKLLVLLKVLQCLLLCAACWPTPTGNIATAAIFSFLVTAQAAGCPLAMPHTHSSALCVTSIAVCMIKLQFRSNRVCLSVSSMSDSRRAGHGTTAASPICLHTARFKGSSSCRYVLHPYLLSSCPRVPLHTLSPCCKGVAAGCCCCSRCCAAASVGGCYCCCCQARQHCRWMSCACKQTRNVSTCEHVKAHGTTPCCWDRQSGWQIQ